jgi:hypothetical protein
MVLYAVQRIVGLPDDSRLIAHAFQMPVDAILCDIETAIDKPFYIRFSEVPFQHLIPFPAPDKLCGYVIPELFRLLYALWRMPAGMPRTMLSSQ